MKLNIIDSGENTSVLRKAYEVATYRKHVTMSLRVENLSQRHLKTVDDFIVLLLHLVDLKSRFLVQLEQLSLQLGNLEEKGD